MGTKEFNPIDGLFENVSKILDYIEIKDAETAASYETTDIRDAANMWMGAIAETDTYLTYRSYWSEEMFKQVMPNISYRVMARCFSQPMNIPLQFRDTLLQGGRQAFLDQYEEKNDYYRMLSGLPSIDATEDDYLYLSDELYETYNVDSTTPIHELSDMVQNSFLATAEYTQLLEDNPDATYLKYIGWYKVDLYIARKSNDYDLIRYDLDRTDINPNLITTFSHLYASYREYVIQTIYNENLNNLYPKYRNFIGLIIKFYTLMQLCNAAVEANNTKQFLDDSALYMILSMYNIPSSLVLTSSVRRKLVTNIYRLIQNKGTDSIYQEIADILGYQDLVVSKLVMLKNQQFDETGTALKDDGTPMESFDDIDNIYMPEYDASLTTQTGSSILSDPQFVKVNITDDDPYTSITQNNSSIYTYNEIVDDDPMWWDLSDTQHILKNSHYSEVDSKYIILEVAIHQIQFMFESIYFTRMILDNKEYTDGFMVTIPEIFGTQSISIYDLMVFVLCATCMNNDMSGAIITDYETLKATAGFNFDLDQDVFMEYLNSCEYVDIDRITTWVTDLVMSEVSDVSRLFNDVMYPMREWIELQMSQSENRAEYIEYENIYRALFTYDANNNTFSEDFEMPLITICDTYGLSNSDIVGYKHFYPRTVSGEALTKETIIDNLQYSTPFVSANLPVTWYIDIVIDDPDFGEVNRGTLYFHDILNSDDIRELTNTDGDRIFMDYEDEDLGWVINQRAVDNALQQISYLKESELAQAIYQTPTVNREYDSTDDTSKTSFNAGDYLPSAIRTGVFKNILKDKITMDCNGLAVPPSTYIDYLYRKNIDLYNLLMDDNRFDYDKDSWSNDVMTIVSAIETELSMHMKYFEQASVGQDMFFKPLLTLIAHFKSTFVEFAKTGISYVFGDKVDAGGNSNMLKLFDEVTISINFVVLAVRGYESQLGLYDAEAYCKHKLLLSDISKLTKSGKNNANGYDRNPHTGSVRLVDEAMFFLNGDNVDPSGHTSAWYSGDYGNGRWEDDANFTQSTYYIPERINVGNYDTEAWKYNTESYVE